jgi:hypothetical protein
MVPADSLSLKYLQAEDSAWICVVTSAPEQDVRLQQDASVSAALRLIIAYLFLA